MGKRGGMEEREGMEIGERSLNRKCVVCDDVDDDGGGVSSVVVGCPWSRRFQQLAEFERAYSSSHLKLRNRI